MRSPAAALALALLGACTGAAADDVITLSVVATTDLHGYAFASSDRGGLALLGGYFANVRAARAADGGAVVLIDTGDTFLGGIESSLSEGALIVDAYEALGYAALVIGNHEFDFGQADVPGLRQSLDDDLRGALKAAAARAPFPFLAANLVEEASGLVVDWPNVRPSVIVQAAGVKVGIVGVMSIDALRGTLRANVRGLRVTPLAEAITREAVRLREAGAEVVVAGAHAGGACGEFGNPKDLSSCDMGSEIFAVARALPGGLVDAIVAGHSHQAVAHEVAGIPIVQGYPHGRGFGRVDLMFDTRTRRVARHTIFAPQDVCARLDACDAGAAVTSLPAVEYEGRPVAPSAEVTAAMRPTLARVRELQSVPLGVVLETPLARTGNPEAPLGNLFADALRERTGADVALNNNARGGLRADLPAGELTFGRLYEAFPFDNRVVTVTLSGDALQTVLADEVRRNRPGTLAISGLRVAVSCTAGVLDIDLLRPDGTFVFPYEELTLAAMESVVQGPIFRTVPVPEFSPPPDAPLLRELVEDWVRDRGGRLRDSDFVDPALPRWEYPPDGVAACVER